MFMISLLFITVFQKLPISNEYIQGELDDLRAQRKAGLKRLDEDDDEEKEDEQ